MISKHRRSARFGLVISLLAGVVLPLGAGPARAAPANATPAAPVPWLYVGSDVPHDARWTFGVLPNGLRYAVRHNGVPPGQVSVRVVADVGSLYETDAQRGYAHLIEHLTFRDSKYLKSGEAIPTWQKLGATFGSDTNAETSPTETVYKLDVPNASPEVVDTTFKLLSGMIAAPIFTPQGVKTEVPIVLAEMRERQGPEARVIEATRAAFFKGQLLADRSPIGKVETLNAATSESIKAFHDKWYRPDNTVIVVVGDADPATLVGEITKWFGDWQGVGKKPLQPDFGEPMAPAGAGSKAQIPVDEAAVIVEPDLPRVFNTAILRPWHKINDTIVYNEGNIIDRLALALINRRLEARARGNAGFLAASVDQSRISRSADTTLITVTPLGDNWKSAVHDVRAVLADAMTTPPNKEEIAREIAEFDVSYKVPVETQETAAGSKLADEIAEAVDIRETVANPDTVYSIFKQTIPLFTPATVLAHTRALFAGTVERAILITPKPSDGTAQDVRLALTTPVDAAAGSRVAASALKFADLPAVGTPGKVVDDVPTGLLGIERMTLSNGVKVLLWPNDAEPGRIIVRVRFGAGYAAIKPQDAVYAPLAEVALMDSGFAKYGREDLDRLATGRKLSLDFDITDTTLGFYADTRPADMADQLYLYAAKLAMPRWDEHPIVRALAASRLNYESTNGSPMKVLQRDLPWLIRDGDLRYAQPNPAELAKATPEGFRRVWEPLLQTGPIEVDLFGDFPREVGIAALERSFGALPTRTSVAPPPLTPHLPAHNNTPLVLTHRGDPDAAAAVVAWPTGGGRTGLRESRQLELLAQIYQNRLFDVMREKIGASYAPQVSSSWPLELSSGGYFAATTQLRPRDLPAFFAATDQIAADLAAAPPSADEIARVTEPVKQWITRLSTGNGFYLDQLQGGALETRKIADLRSILNDSSTTTPAEMQDLAKRYLKPGATWKLEVVPEKK
jgi:zinc protease